MPAFQEILKEMHENLNNKGSGATIIENYIKNISNLTGRNTVAYYSGFLSAGSKGSIRTSIIDEDMNGFMSMFYGIDKRKGLDLILHTPGGDVCATEAIGNYIIKMFGRDIRIIIPQLAMSGGTVWACMGKVIIMGKQSSIGPIDPQINGMPAHGIINEFDRIMKEVKKNPSTIVVWREILSKYYPTLLWTCQHALNLSKEIASKWLSDNMFAEEIQKNSKINRIIKVLNSSSNTLNHARHFDCEYAKKLGLKVEELENNQDLQDAVLSLHHALMITFSMNPNCLKIMVNNIGNPYILAIPQVAR